MRKSHTFITLLLHICFLNEGFSRHGPECDDNLFYSPYVKVRRKKNGGDIDSLEKNGFIDLSRYVSVMLCINGPAVLLSNYEEVINDTTTIHIFSKGTMKVYNHECMKINKVPKTEVDRLHAARAPAKITQDVLVVGVRAAGIHLIGTAGDYRRPRAAFFHRQNYGHDIRKDKIITDGSFAIIGGTNITVCLRVNQDFNVILKSKAKTDNEICVWTIKNIDDRYERYKDIFRSNRTIFDYEWQKCPPGGIIPIDPPGPSPPNLTTTPAPLLDAFAFINPHGKRSPKTTTTTTEFPPVGPTLVTQHPRPPPAEIQVEYSIDLEICQPFPVIDKNGCIPPPIPDRSCDLTNQVLLIKPKYLEEELKWKSEILELIAEIFGKICEPFLPDFAYTINRVLEYYLILAHGNDLGIPSRFRRQKPDIWKVIINDLHICNKKITTPIYFDWIFQNLTDEGDFYFRRRKKRSPLYEFRRSKSHRQKSPWNLDKKKSKADKKRSRKSHKSPKSRTSSRKTKFNPQKRKYQDPMEFLEELSYPSSHSIKRSSLMAMIESNESEPIASTYTLASFNQESIRRISHRDYHFIGYPTDVHHVNRSDIEGPNRTSIFYYESNAELIYELNVGIDIAYKIWATVAGYCNTAYQSRQSETFPRFYNTYFEDFMEPVENDWKFAVDNEILKAILSEYNSDDNIRWLDTCLEASYIDSNTQSFRAPRPVLVGGERAEFQPEANAFLEIPLEQYQRFHSKQTAPMSNIERKLSQPKKKNIKKQRGKRKPNKI